jgi:hypothetical protein
MKLSLRTVALLMPCFLLQACNDQIHYKPLPIPQDKIDCAVLIKRPPITDEYVIDWATVKKAPTKEFAIQLAQLEVQKLLSNIHSRELTVVNYIVNIEGILYGCSSDAEWMRDYTKKMTK